MNKKEFYGIGLQKNVLKVLGDKGKMDIDSIQKEIISRVGNGQMSNSEKENLRDRIYHNVYSMNEVGFVQLQKRKEKTTKNKVIEKIYVKLNQNL